MASLSNPDRQTVPKSLFNVCMQLVAENLDLVESFHGFPALIGERIFQSAIKCHKFSDHNYAQLSLKLFTEAFKEDILSSLNLSKQHLGLNYYIEDFLMFKDLVEMDVSYCGLGDDHEILTHISAMKSLQNLVLSYNALSDQGIQKMTTPFRMFQKGPEHLSFIDLKGNHVSLKCLKFLSCFKDLQSVLLPIKHCTERQERDEWTVIATDYKHTKIATKGWAADVINTWMNNSRTSLKTKQPVKKSFYSRLTLKEINLDKNHPEETGQPSSVCLLATKTTPRKNNSFSLSSGKRTRRNCEENVDSKVIIKDEQKTLIENEFDPELLELYKSSESTDKNSMVFETSSNSKLLHGLNGNDKVKENGLQSDFSKVRSKTDCRSNKDVSNVPRQNLKAINKRQVDGSNFMNNTFKSDFTHSNTKLLTDSIPDSHPNKKRRLNICKK